MEPQPNLAPIVRLDLETDLGDNLAYANSLLICATQTLIRSSVSSD